MLNNYTVLVGIIEEEPKLKEDANSKDKVCTFNIVVKDNKHIRRINCMATNRLCDQMMIYGLAGTFWAIGGILYNHQSDKMKKSRVILKCLEIELLHQPKIPGISVKEFIENYSPDSIMKRAKERKRK